MMHSKNVKLNRIKSMLLPAGMMVLFILVGVLLWLKTRFIEIAPVPTMSGVDIEQVMLPQLAAIDDYAALEEKPILMPTRRLPTEEDSSTEVPTPEEQKQPSVAGIFRIDGIAKALLKVEDDPKPLWVTEGGQAFGWQIDKIEHHSVSLIRGEQKLVIEIERNAGAPTAPRPMQPVRVLDRAQNEQNAQGQAQMNNLNAQQQAMMQRQMQQQQMQQQLLQQQQMQQMQQQSGQPPMPYPANQPPSSVLDINKVPAPEHETILK